MTRILVVDRSELLTWIVKRLAPAGTVVERATGLADAARCLHDNPPDVAVFHLERCRASWRELLDLCVDGPRVIPFVCTGELEQFEVCGCEVPCRMEDFIPSDATSVELASRIASLVEDSNADESKLFRRGREPWVEPDGDPHTAQIRKT